MPSATTPISLQRRSIVVERVSHGEHLLLDLLLASRFAQRSVEKGGAAHRGEREDFYQFAALGRIVQENVPNQVAAEEICDTTLYEVKPRFQLAK